DWLLRRLSSAWRWTALLGAARRLPTAPCKSRAARDEQLLRGERGVDQTWYLATYPDVAAAGVDPVRHYFQFGWRESRKPRREFSTRGYLADHEEVARAGQNPFIHYLREEELARGERGVDQSWYLARYPDIAAAGMDPASHYLQFGWREGR